MRFTRFFQNDKGEGQEGVTGFSGMRVRAGGTKMAAGIQVHNAGAGVLSIWCEGSSEKVYAAVTEARCPKCGKVVELTHRGHIKPHIEQKLGDAATAKKK